MRVILNKLIKASSVAKTLAVLIFTAVYLPPAWGHSASINEQSVLVCENKAIKDKCSYSNNDGDLYRGSCQLFSETLMCVRNLPIIKAEHKNEQHQVDHSNDTSTNHTHPSSEDTYNHNH